MAAKNISSISYKPNMKHIFYVQYVYSENLTVYRISEATIVPSGETNRAKGQNYYANGSFLACLDPNANNKISVELCCQG
jgi:hypothetical protein